MDNNGCLPCTRREGFPAGLRVLVVDDDPTWLKILEKMLKKCSYQVTTCCLATEALKKLRERKDAFDIVISDVNMPDMNGFKLLEHVGLEMDLPVIMMSVDGETSRVMKGVQHGACDYLLKPIRMKELRNIWQHVLRKRIHEGREFESLEGFDFEGIHHLMRNGQDQCCDDVSLFALEDCISSTRKRKDADNKHDEREFGDSSSTKKARVVWSVDLHQKFVQAVNQIGFDKVGPKKILDLMNVPWLTRENVASHLQKYRLYLSRLQKQRDQKKCSSSGIKNPDLNPKDPGSSSIKNSMNKQQNVVSIDGFRCPNNGLVQLHESDFTVSELNKTEQRRALATNNIIPDPNMTKVSQIVLNQTFSPLNSEGNIEVFDCTIPTQYTWNQVPKRKLQDDPKSQSIASMVSSPSAASSIASSAVDNIIPVQSKSLMVNDQSSVTSNPGLKTQEFDASLIPDLEFYQQNLLWGGEAAFSPLEEDLNFFLLQSECYNDMNFGMHSIDMSDYYYDPGLTADVPNHLLYDSADYSVVDQSLFIA
ncbi:hypothetical protein HN51_038376 [Arachis hypogaea]|uniref:two-component response regulator ARR11-like n=1 Tax=Arachis stenosperma TaxID=217475 RepID=UPI0025AC774F|nr:two-component response regulator ARR11-like [Arachis stenosperma]XP_057751137.1 two-component response regulator ARR11-like [Arachis stenosperma]